MLTLTQGRGRPRLTEKAAVFGEKIRAKVPTVAPPPPPRPVTSADRPYSFVPPFTPRPPVSSRPPSTNNLDCFY